ncbi:MAG: ClbS/DfsB family four-helix bundle protein [Bacteroidota bacterium]
MARPKDKSQLLAQSRANYEKLILFIEGFSKQEQEKDFPNGTLNRNIRDVLAHLHYWHLMMVDWYTVGMSGQKPDMPAKGYTWRTVPELNRSIQERYCKVDLEDCKALLKQSFKIVTRIIEAHTDEELFTKKKYPWTGSTSLGSYLISATSSHYDWAYKLIKKVKKEEVITQ